MRYPIQFDSHLTLDRPLLPQHLAYLKQFVQRRRIVLSVEYIQAIPDPLRDAVGLPLGEEGAYFVGLDFDKERPRNPIALNVNRPPHGQPSLYCAWRFDLAGMSLNYSDSYNLYLCYVWLQYLLEHFLLPWGYRLHGEIYWQGAETADHGKITAYGNTLDIRLDQAGSRTASGTPVLCLHPDAQETALVCVHLAGRDPDSTYHRWFTGEASQSHLICQACANQLKEGTPTVALSQICWRCYKELEAEGDWDGIIGMPTPPVRSTSLSITKQRLPWPLSEPLLDVQPLEGQRESIWIALTASGHLVEVNLSAGTTQSLMQLMHSNVDLEQMVSLHLSPDGQFAAVVNTKGQHGSVLDLKARQVTMQLERDTYHIEHSRFPAAFFTDENRLLLIHGTAWNRLDISDPYTGALITARTWDPVPGKPAYEQEHYLDYFHCSLSVSPDQQWIADNGWFWSPIGIVMAWNLQRWVRDNVWESEDGSTRKQLCDRWYYWDGPLCWIDGHTLAIWGYGEDDEWLIPAVRIFDVRSGAELRWFAGPEKGTLIFDEYLFSLSEQHGFSGWDIATGERVLSDPDFRPTSYHRGAKQFLQLDAPNGEVIVGTLTR